MAVSVHYRPYGHKLTTIPLVANVTNSGGQALITYLSHGLTSLDYVYVNGPIENYNGFRQVSVVDANTFKLNPKYKNTNVIDTSELEDFVEACEITWYKKASPLNIMCLHLPILYRIKSSLWPTSNSSTATVTTFVNDNGYVRLTLSGSIGTATLDFVKIAGTSALDGIYQILWQYSSTSITIDLAYSGTYSFSGGTAQWYLNNYAVLVDVYAGLSSTTTSYFSQRPVAKIVSLKLVPDSDNYVKFDISSYIKSSFDYLKNNCLGGTLPNDISQYTEFYIAYGETYDSPIDGYTLGTYSAITGGDSLTFVGVAVNSKLPFKNLYSGHVMDYMYAGLGTEQKFLTSFENPVLFTGVLQEIFFIKHMATTYLLELNYSNGSIVNQTYQSLPVAESGLFRKFLTDSPYDRKDVVLVGGVTTFLAPNSWTNISFTTTTATIFRKNSGGGGQGLASLAVTLKAGSTPPTIKNASIQLTGTVQPVLVRFYYTDGVNTLDSQVTVNSSLTLTDFAFAGPITFDANLLVLETYNAGPDTTTVTVDTTGPIGTMIGNLVGYVALSEIKQYEVNNLCRPTEDITLIWMAPNGGFDQWTFISNKDIGIEIGDVKTQNLNIFSNWPESYGAMAQTIRREISRSSRNAYKVRSQYLTEDQADAIGFIKTSPLVQIRLGQYDFHTVTVDANSFRKYTEGDKEILLEFDIVFTDEIPSQSL